MTVLRRSSVNDAKNTTLCLQYRELAAQERHVFFGGRLGEYKYYDMAPVIENVMNLFMTTIMH